MGPVNRTSVVNICKRHDKAGPAALLDAPDGRKIGDGRALDAEEEIVLRRLLAELSYRTVARYLARWGYGTR